MKTEIKIGLMFRLISTGRTYEVTRTSDVSVWFKDVTRDMVWRESKNTLLQKFNNGYEII